MSCAGVVLAAFLLWLFQCGLYQRFWKKGLSASVVFLEEFVTEGENAVLAETITNAKYLPIPALHVKFQTGKELVFVNQENSTVTDRNYRSDIFSCMPWQQISRRLEVCCTKRGLYEIRQVDLVSYDLLWSSHFYETVPVETSLYVFPSMADPMRLQPPLRQLTGDMAMRRALFRDPFELQAVRDYTREDSRRSINWKATARTGSLKVNVFAPAASCQVMILLDGDSDRLWADQELTEETVRLAAALAGQLTAWGIPVAVRSNIQDCLTHEELKIAYGAGREHMKEILKGLARADTDSKERRPMQALVKELADMHSRTFGRNTGMSMEFFILLSPCQREELAKACADLYALSPGSQWILPIRRGDSLRLRISDQELCGHFYPYFYPWEAA